MSIRRVTRQDLESNFTDVLRGNGTLHGNVNLGAYTVAAITPAVESFWRGKTMLRDAKSEKLVTA